MSTAGDIGIDDIEEWPTVQKNEDGEFQRVGVPLDIQFIRFEPHPRFAEITWKVFEVNGKLYKLIA